MGYELQNLICGHLADAWRVRKEYARDLRQADFLRVVRIGRHRKVLLNFGRAGLVPTRFCPDNFVLFEPDEFGSKIK